MNKFRSKSTQAINQVKANFIAKFQGKTHFVSKEGVNCILFKENEEQTNRQKRSKSVPLQNKIGVVLKERGESKEIKLPSIYKKQNWISNVLLRNMEKKENKLKIVR